MRIELLYFEGCPGYEALLPALRELLASEGVESSAGSIAVRGPIQNSSGALDQGGPGASPPLGELTVSVSSSRVEWRGPRAAGMSRSTHSPEAAVSPATSEIAPP